jgi:hypothetical protein
MKLLRQTLFVAAIAFLSTSCKNKGKEANTNASDTTKFYPLSAILKEEIATEKQTPYYIYKTTVINNGKMDSVAVTQEELEQLAAPFFQYDITKPPLKQNYTESVFRDLGTTSTIFNYSTKVPEMEVRNIDIALDINTDHLKRIDIKTFIEKGDSTVEQSLSWIAGKRFYIQRYVKQKNDSSSTTKVTVVWNNK